MPLPRWVARANRRFTNRLLGPIVANLPGFGIVVHTGRTTRRTYRTPVLAFRHGGRYTVALTYGPESDWVRNVVASNGCTLETRRGAVQLRHPRLLRDERALAVPPLVRSPLRLARISHFLELQAIQDNA